MGTDLLSACVFCAGLLLGMELAPAPGTSAEIAGAYATFQREAAIGAGRKDFSDVTPKFVGVGLRGAWSAPEGLGAGTPAREWRVRLALGPSHDEQEQMPASGRRTTASGTGRYENVAALYRQPLALRGSLELAWNRRTHKATDLVNLGDANFEFGEQRVLSAERVDVSLGWRHRFAGLELAASGRYARPDGSNATARAFHAARGDLLGAGAEARWRRGSWALWASGERLSGDVDVHEESAPDFASRDFSAAARFEALHAGVSRTWGRTDISFSATYDRSKLPFVALAVLGVETDLFDSGFHPESRTEETIWDLAVRREISPDVRLRLFFRAIHGDEKVVLTDSARVRPDQRITIRRGGDIGKGTGSLDAFGNPQFVLGIGAEFSIGRRGRAGS